MRRRNRLHRRKFNWRIILFLSFLVTGIILFFLWKDFFLSHSKKIPQDGGIYTESTVGEIRNLSPFANDKTFVDQDLQSLIFAGLLKYNPKTKEFQSDLGTLEKSEQGKIYTVTLKDDIKFSDGSDVDIADVIFTYDTVLKNPFFYNKDLRQAFEYVELNVIDARTISFKLLEQNSFFPSLLTLPIVPKKYLDEVLIEEISDPNLPFNQNPVGAGPFIIKNILRENGNLTRVFLEANPYYHLHKPYIDQMVFYIYSDSKILENQHQWPTTFSRIPARNIKSFQKKLFDQYSRIDYTLPRFMGLFFNLDSAITKYPEMRKSLSEILPAEEFLEDDWKHISSPFFKPEIKSSNQTLDELTARKILRDNGFPYDNEQEKRVFSRSKELVTLKMITSTEPAVYSRMAQKVQKIWQESLLLDVQLEILEPQAFQKALSERTYDVVLYGQNFSNNADVLSVWHSSQTGRFNLSNLTREDVDFLIHEIRFSGADVDYQALQNKLDELHIIKVLGTPKYGLLVGKDLQNMDGQWASIWSFSDRFYNIYDWYFNETKDWDLKPHQSKYMEFILWLWNGKN